MRKKYISVLAVIVGGMIPYLSATEVFGAEGYYAVTESKNIFTEMVTSKIQMSSSSEQCERQRKKTQTEFMSTELSDVFHSICLRELPSRLEDAVAVNNRHPWSVAIAYVDDGIETTEIFYNVDRSWTDTEACIYMVERYKQLDPNVECNAYLDKRTTGNNYFDKFGPLSGITPTAAIVREEDEARTQLAQEQRENEKATKYWSSINDSAIDCVAKNPGEAPACWERVLPEKCSMLVYPMEFHARSLPQWFACAQSCRDAGFYSRTFGECSREYRLD